MATDQDILIRLGQRIRKLRLEMNYSQEELAHRAKLHRTYVGMIERGEKNITLRNLFKIAQALKISASALLDDV